MGALRANFSVGSRRAARLLDPTYGPLSPLADRVRQQPLPFWRLRIGSAAATLSSVLRAERAISEAMMFRLVKLSINGRPLWVDLKGETEHLSGLLRSLAIVGPSADCSTGQCAACTVLVGDSPVKSCTVKSEACAGKDITTAERLDHGPSVHPMLAAFRNHGIAACLTCMPGMVLAAIAYAAREREMTKDEVSRDLVADVCRCEFADNMIAAVLDGARAMHDRGNMAEEE